MTRLQEELLFLKEEKRILSWVLRKKLIEIYLIL